MTHKDNFVFIESNTTGTGELLTLKVLEKGLVPVFVTANPAKYNFDSWENIELVILDTSNKDILLNYLKSIDSISGIYSSSEAFIETASWLADKLGLPGSNVDTIKICRNKYSLYEIIKSSAIQMPITYRVMSLVEAGSILNLVDFPLIVKPGSESGSKGVKLCYDKKECRQHIDLLLQNGVVEVLLQEYIDAPEYCVEIFSLQDKHHVMGITKKYVSKPPYFIGTGHDFPVPLLAQVERNIKNTVKELLSILGFNFGFSHIDLKIKDG